VGSASQEAVEAAARGGYTLPKYVATEGTVTPQVASSLKNVPWGGQPIVRTHDELLANMGRSASEIAPGAGTVETAGQAAKAGLTDYVKAGSKGEVSAAYKAVDALIDPEVRLPLDNTRATVADIMARNTNARLPARSKGVDLVFDAVQDPRGMNYAGTKDLRSYLGEKTNFQLAAEGIDPRENLAPPVFRRGVVRLEDLQAGMELRGTVLNVVDFGAFACIEDGLEGLIHVQERRLTISYCRIAFRTQPRRRCQQSARRVCRAYIAVCHHRVPCAIW